jgi:hypothetical protein
MAKTTTELLTAVKRLITMPASQVLMTNTDMLAIADDVLMRNIVPAILASRQDFLMGEPTTTATVADQAAYSIPVRAVGRAIREVKLLDGSDNARNLSLIQLEDEHLFADTGAPTGFYFRGDKLILVPAPDSDDYSIKMWYPIQPSNLVESTAVATVVSTTTTVVTVNSTPSGITSGSVVDFIQGVSGNSLLATDKTVASTTTTTITFAANTIPTGLVAGDYIALAQRAPVFVGIPDEAFPWIKLETGAEILYAVGDYDGQAKLLEQANKHKEAFLQLIQPRAVGEPTKIINRNGLLRRRFYKARRAVIV